MASPFQFVSYGGGGGGGASVGTNIQEHSGGGGTIVGAVNGVNTVFTLSQTPNSSARFLLAANGGVLTQGVDYTLLVNQFTMVVAPNNPTVFTAQYTY